MPYITKEQLKRLENFAYLNRCAFFNAEFEDITPMIKEATKLYRETWVIPIIEELKNKLGVMK